MRLVRLSDEYVVNLDELREATFESAAVTSARLYVYVGDDCEPTVLEGDEAIAAWRLLRDLCESPSTLTSGGTSRR